MVARWWLVLFAAAVWDTISSQPHNSKHKTECCPCPKDASGASLTDDQAAAGSSVEGARAAAGGVRGAGDCPCARYADSEGAPSMFFPAAVRAVRPFISDSKENPDPLLHPEVNLASSVLETLREATNEEYKEALARDAARAADEEAAESTRNLVTVIINPKDAVADDDVMSEASHVHEARCINPPSARSSLRTPYKPISLTDILNLPRRSPTFRSWSPFDMDSGVGASNVNEQVVQPAVNNEARFKSNDLSPDFKPLSTLEKLKLKIPSINLNGERSSFNAQPVLPKRKAPPKIQLPDLSSLMPKLNTQNLLRRHQDGRVNSVPDSQKAPSVFKDRHFGFARENSKDDIKTIKPVQTTAKSKTATKIELPNMNNFLPKFNSPNLLKAGESKDLSITSDSQDAASVLNERFTGLVKDDSKQEITKPGKTAERPNNILSPYNINFGEKLDPINANTEHSEARDATTDMLNNLLKGLDIMPNLSNLFSSDIFSKRNNDQNSKSNELKDTTDTRSESKTFATEILDAVPSPSEIKPDHLSLTENANDDIENNENIENEEMQKMIDQNPMKTEIIDQVPNSSEIDDMNKAQVMISTGSNPAPKDNNVANNENIELNNEMETINDEDIIEASIINDINRESQFENFAPSDMETIKTNRILISKEPPQITNFDEFKVIDNNEGEESITENKINEETSLPLRQRIKNTLDNIKLRAKIHNNKLNIDKTVPLSNIENDLANKDEQVESGSHISDSSSEPLSTQILDSIPSEDSTVQVEMEDLQQMSDSLLDKEKNHGDMLTESSDIEPSIKDDSENELKTDEIAQNNDREPLTDINAANIEMDINNEEDKSVSNKNSNNDLKVMECLEMMNKNSPGPSDSSTGINAKSNNEMASEASDLITNTVKFDDKLGSPLKQSILQPPSLPDLNPFNLPTIDMENLFNINNPLPALQLNNILKTKESHEKFSSTRDDDVDILGIKQRSSPSTASFKSALPPLQPLEDINLDILQLQPIGSELPSIPRLNLNSFKTRLAIPESLQLRPLMLESSIGNKKGVVGASLTFADDKKGRSNMLEQASLKRPSILGRPLGSFPSLDDLRSTMLENAQNLFNTPLETTSRNVVEDTLRSGQVLTENLRVGAENTVKDIQRNLESTFNGVGLKSHGFLSSPYLRSPNDLFEEISRKHEDVNDKLKGISYDLSDRLETFRNSIFDGFPSLGSPMPMQSSFIKPKSKSSNYSNKGKKVGLVTDSGTKGKFITRSSSNKNKLKMPTAASIPALKTVSKPGLRTVEPPKLRLGTQSPRTQLISREKPTLSLFQNTDKKLIDTGRPVFKKSSLPKLRQNKVKITFSTTPLPPILKNKSRFQDLGKSKLTRDGISLPTLSKSSSKNKPGLLGTSRDSTGFASEPVSARVIPSIKDRQGIKGLKRPMRPRIASLDGEDDKYTVLITTKKPLTDPPSLIGPKPPTLNKTYTSNADHMPSGQSTTFKHPIVPSGAKDKISAEPLLRNNKPLSWPKVVDDTFLTKVREALRARLAGISLNNSKPSSQAKIDDGKSVDDMAKSASDNIVSTDVGPQIMKENTSYTCKMMCTKNS